MYTIQEKKMHATVSDVNAYAPVYIATAQQH